MLVRRNKCEGGSTNLLLEKKPEERIRETIQGKPKRSLEE
jgi:hypothetical protein